MAEPNVDFELNGIDDPKIREQFDQFRRWYEFREDNKYPAMLTFEGQLLHDQEARLYVPGQVYGSIGSTETSSGYWWNMELTVGAPAFNQCYFALETENIDNTFVTVRCRNTANSEPLKYTATVFYRN